VNIRPVIGLALVMGVTLVACKKKEPPTPPPAPPPPLEEIKWGEPKAFTFTDTNQVISRAEIKTEPNKFVEVDFNGDGKSDLVVAERIPDSTPVAEARPQVSVFIRRSDNSYFLGGKILEEIPGRIKGMAYRQASKNNRFADLVLIYELANGKTEVVSYKNDGTSFKRME